MIKTAYIHGRPSGHPIHDKYASVINADFYFSDHKLRWNDVPDVSKFKRTLSWIVCALTFPSRKKYSVFLCEGVREPVLFMKWLGLMGSNQKYVALMANETLFFLSIKKYSRPAEFIMRSFLKKCDAIICIGAYQAQLANKLFPKANVYTIFNGIPDQKMAFLQSLTPKLTSNKILVITSATTNQRMYYKGLDLAFDTFNKLIAQFPDLELHVLGFCSDNIINQCMDRIESQFHNKIVFHGHVKIEDHLSDAGILLQLGRGDSYPTSTIECAAAGIPVFITEETGIKELVAKISSEFITSLEVDDIMGKIKKYIESLLTDKKKVSDLFKQTALSYTESGANENFIKTYQTVCEDLFPLRNNR